MLGGGSQPEPAVPRGGADDEDTRRAFEGDGQEDPLAVGCRDHWGDAADHAALEGALRMAAVREAIERKGLFCSTRPWQR